MPNGPEVAEMAHLLQRAWRRHRWRQLLEGRGRLKRLVHVVERYSQRQLQAVMATWVAKMRLRSALALSLIHI
eukprot:4125910-Amphidinium_carterae.1